MRAAASPLQPIDVQSLRVGMFVHLEVGWMSHPFPLSSFKITTAQQIETIRGLGLKQVRWHPQQSDPVEPAEPAAAAEGGAQASGAIPLATAPGSLAADALGPASEAAPLSVRDSAPAPLTPLDSPARARADRIRRLDAERAAQHVCERQFQEAAKACRQTAELAPMKPVEAKAQAESLTRALLDKMLGEGDVCIRLLNEAVGERASMHALNVMIIGLLMGRTFGFSDADLLDLGVGAMLHDIGKAEMPLRVRHRDETFTAVEQRDYEEHVAHGLAMARRMGLSPGATLVIAQHHEHADGSGFPLKLNTDRMTVAARIVALVDRYDNLCNPYFTVKALTPHESLSLLFAQGKTRFDTSILGAFIRMMGVYPPGSTVQLTDDRYAMVVSVNSSRPLKPNVIVHDPKVPREEALAVDLETAQGLGIRRSIKPMQLPPAAIEYLSPRERIAYFFEPAARPARECAP